MPNETHHILKGHELLYVFSMGKRLRVIAIFTDDADANAYMATHSDAAVIASHGKFVFLANKYDRGLKTPDVRDPDRDVYADWDGEKPNVTT